MREVRRRPGVRCVQEAARGAPLRILIRLQPGQNLRNGVHAGVHNPHPGWMPRASVTE